MGIQLCYTDSQKNAHTREYGSGVTEIDLSYQKISSIDLSPLILLTDLRILDLHQNEIVHLDLSPLSSCISLQNLNLAENRIQTINLAPLSSCASLQLLSLGGNQLETINLSPIDSCTDLHYLGLWHNKLQNIDFSPLTSCSRLEIIHLHENQLQHIDLSPLRSSSNLKEIALAENQLDNIDLNPLAVHTKLAKLFLYNNELKTVDLSPLSSCKNLEIVTLRGNDLTSINLTPLASCANLRYLYLQDNQLTPVDLTPLISNPVIDFEVLGVSWLRRSNTSYERPTIMYPWSFLYQVARMYKSDQRVQHDILYALNLESYGFVDHNLTDIFTSISPETPTEEARKQITRLLVVEIAGVVDRGGTTTGLMLEELITKHSEIAVRTQRIIKLRENEMRSVVIGIREDKMDLSGLWLTAYGYEILKALGMKVVMDLVGWKQVLKAVDEIGYTLKRATVVTSQVRMSRNLKESIWWIAENGSKPWSEITELIV